MKLITAYIKPERLTAVKQELFKSEIFKMSITNALGCGRQKGYMEAYRGVVQEVNLHKKVRMEIAVNDEFVEQTSTRSSPAPGPGQSEMEKSS